MAGESADGVARRHREKIARLERAALAWERGAHGERLTATLLGTLPSHEWTTFNDIQWPGRQLANIDHVVVGPPGVFVIDSKNWSGAIKVDGQVLRQNGRSRETAVAGAAEAAMAVTGLIGGDSPVVTPVLCFVRDEPITGWARDVVLCSTSNVLQMLTTRPVVLDSVVRSQLCLELDACFRSADQAPGRPAARARSTRPPTPRPRRSSSPPARRSRRGRGLIGSVMGLMLTLAAIAVAINIIERMAGQIAATGIGSHDVTGAWTGSYSCAGGTAKARLIIRAVHDSRSEVAAILTFGPSRATPSYAQGSFRLEGAVQNSSLHLTPKAWIRRPDGYTLVGLTSNRFGAMPSELSGMVTGCSTFRFVKARR